MTSTPTLSIVLPCYNEAESIQDIFSKFREVLENRDDVEVVFVNNGSDDGSQAIMEAAAKDPAHGWTKIVQVEENQGYGYGIMTGIRHCAGDILSWTHADMQTDPADVLASYRQFVAQPNMESVFLKGRRVGRYPMDAFFTCGMSLVASMALGKWLSDVNAQPKMFHRRFLEQMTEPPDDFSLDLYAYYLAKKLGMGIVDCPVNFAKRKHGLAKGGGTVMGKLRLIKRTWTYIFLLRRTLGQ